MNGVVSVQQFIFLNYTKFLSIFLKSKSIWKLYWKASIEKLVGPLVESYDCLIRYGENSFAVDIFCDTKKYPGIKSSLCLSQGRNEQVHPLVCFDVKGAC